MFTVLLGGCITTSIDRVETLTPYSTINTARDGIVDGRVALLLAPAVKGYVWQGRVSDAGITGAGRLKVIPIGRGIEVGFRHGCKQVFANCRVVETMPAGGDYDVVIIPRVLNYSFR